MDSFCLTKGEKMLTKQKICFYPYKIFEFNKRKYLYTIKSSGIYEIDDRTEKLFQYNNKTVDEIRKELEDDFNETEFEEIIRDMIQENVLYCKGISKLDVVSEIESNISALTLMVVQECNMRCTYCYGNGGEYNNKGKMKIETARKAVDYLVETSKENNLHIAFLGGEPLLNFYLIKEIVEYCKNIEKGTKKRFFYNITTNGTLLNKEIEEYLIQNKVICQISIDGSEEKHDQNRFFANQKGSYDIVVKKTKAMREQNLVTARATVTPENIDYQKIFEHLNGLNFKAIPIAVAQNMFDDSEYDKILEEYKKYIYYFKALIIGKQYDTARKITDIMTAIEKIEYGTERQSGCGAGKKMYAVDINGDLYPCHRFVGNHQFRMGDIYKGADCSSFLNTIDVKKRKGCKECWAQNLCLGGCPHENYTNTGNINQASLRNCKMAKMVYEELIKLYVELDDEAKKHLLVE